MQDSDDFTDADALEASVSLVNWFRSQSLGPDESAFVCAATIAYVLVTHVKQEDFTETMGRYFSHIVHFIALLGRAEEKEKKKRPRRPIAKPGA